MNKDTFDRISLVDFEYISRPGERPDPVCLVVVDFKTQEQKRFWRDELNCLPQPPYTIDDNSLIVSYYAPAELGCHLSLGWNLPANILDLYSEFRWLTNGSRPPCGNGLLGALTYFGIACMASNEKETMRDLVLQGPPWTMDQQQSILDYCASDVMALGQLLKVMLPHLDMPRALLRGRYMKAVSHMEHNGIPIDVDALGSLRNNWEDIQDSLINQIDRSYGVFDGRTFKHDLWERFVTENDIPWPRLESGNLDLKDETFREMARMHPSVAPIRELRLALSQLRLSNLEVGIDGRNRCMLSPFSSKTGRNQPSNSKYIFGPSVWLRGLIRPKPGMGIAYIDWEQQEFGIAAALSQDSRMMEAYQSGDPYLAFAKQVGSVPEEATKASHSAEREKFKACVLAVQYGMGHMSLAQRIGCPDWEAKELLRLHRTTYEKFWTWSDSVADHAELERHLWTVFGWQIHYPGEVNPRSARNFPMQANGAEMLRLACCFATESGIKVCAPVHDAILIEFELSGEEDVVVATQEWMRASSAEVLGGFELRTEALIVRYPDRYMDKRGREMWDNVWSIIAEIEQTGNIPSPGG